MLLARLPVVGLKPLHGLSISATLHQDLEREGRALSIGEVAEDILRHRDQRAQLVDFRRIAAAVLDILESESAQPMPARRPAEGYRFYRIDDSPLTRPINTALFSPSRRQFDDDFDQFIDLCNELRQSRGQSPLDRRSQRFADRRGIESVLYTCAQAVGTALDTVGTQGARKNAGTQFENLIKAVLSAVGISNSDATLRIPVSGSEDDARALQQAPRVSSDIVQDDEGRVTVPDIDVEEGSLTFGPQVDAIVSPHSVVPISVHSIDAREVLVSIKTTSKDRMAKIFVDHYILRRLLGQEVRTVCVFLHDVQRSKMDVSPTFVAGMFLVYRRVFGDMSGIYYIDPPIRAESGSWSKRILPFRRFLLDDVWRLISG